MAWSIASLRKVLLLTFLIGLTSCQRAYQRGVWDGIEKSESWHKPYENDQQREIQEDLKELEECRSKEKLDSMRMELDICKATLKGCECK